MHMCGRVCACACTHVCEMKMQTVKTRVKGRSVWGSPRLEVLGVSRELRAWERQKALPLLDVGVSKIILAIFKFNS